MDEEQRDGFPWLTLLLFLLGLLLLYLAFTKMDVPVGFTEQVNGFRLLE